MSTNAAPPQAEVMLNDLPRLLVLVLVPLPALLVGGDWDYHWHFAIVFVIPHPNTLVPSSTFFAFLYFRPCVTWS
jgi:hypothetical protein